MLAALVVSRTSDSVELSTGVRIEIHTASWRALRGYTVVGCVLDEVCFWRSQDSSNPDHEIVNAVRPAMVTVPHSLLVAISSPYSRRGVAWDVFKRHHGSQGDPGILTWQAASRVMNPTIPEAVVTEALEADESAARAEWLAEWRRDIVQEGTGRGRRWPIEADRGRYQEHLGDPAPRLLEQRRPPGGPPPVPHHRATGTAARAMWERRGIVG